MQQIMFTFNWYTFGTPKRKYGIILCIKVLMRLGNLIISSKLHFPARTLNRPPTNVHVFFKESTREQAPICVSCGLYFKRANLPPQFWWEYTPG
jgi:hypothetical protein